jgi:hypothetical protein
MVRRAGLLSRSRWRWILAILGDRYCASAVADDDAAAQVDARRRETRRRWSSSLGAAEQDDMEHLLSD